MDFIYSLKNPLVLQDGYPAHPTKYFPALVFLTVRLFNLQLKLFPTI